jgi:hypothetical protein
MNVLKWFQISRAVGRENHSRVVSLAESVLKKNPDDLAALTFAATHSFHAGDLKSAKRYANKALTSHPEDFDLRCLVIQILQQENNHDGILEQARWLLAIEETNSDPIDLQAIKTVQKLDRLVPESSRFPSATQVLKDNQQLRADYIAWAKEYVSRYA